MTVERSYFFPFRQSLGFPYTSPPLALATSAVQPSAGTRLILSTYWHSHHGPNQIEVHLPVGYRTVTTADCDLLGHILSACPTRERVLSDTHIPAVRCYRNGAESQTLQANRRKAFIISRHRSGSKRAPTGLLMVLGCMCESVCQKEIWCAH